MMKRKVTVCLLAGVLVLAVSAGAAFDSINGYAALKRGVKTLLLESSNVTLEGSYGVRVDGKDLRSNTVKAASDGKNYTEYTKDQSGTKVYESWRSQYNDYQIFYDKEMKAQKHYQGWDAPASERLNLMSIDTDEELAQRMLTFFELAADTAMGDLKNTFVSLGKEDGETRYQVEISASQVPAVVNAGLSLMSYSVTQDDYFLSGNVEYEDFDASFCAYFTQETGQSLTQEAYTRFWNEMAPETWTEEEKALSEQITQLHLQYQEENEAQRKQKGDKGVLLVHADNSQTYYKNGQDYYEAVESDRLIRFVGPDAALDKVHCIFGVDSDGHLTELTLKASFSSTDMNGKAHSLEATASFTASDYGTTTVQPLDVTGWSNDYAYLPDAKATESAEVFN